MKVGVVYKFKPHKKINGTLFYCFEYFRFLRNFVDANFYIVGIAASDMELVRRIFQEKYTAPTDNIIPVRTTDLYGLKLDKTIILDINTFRDCKEFLTNHILCFSNESHNLFRYANDREVTYFGSYYYQPHDQYSLLKFNFDIFKPLSKSGIGVFISALDPEYIRYHMNEWADRFQKPILLKRPQTGVGNIFDFVDSVHYVHTSLDKNNRIIPEAFFYNKSISIEEPFTVLDSVRIRYEDIQQNGLTNYILAESDPMIQLCLKY